MPDLEIYWKTFTNYPSDEGATGDGFDNNMQAIYNIILDSNIEITDCAIYGIIAAAWTIGEMNPARIRPDFFYDPVDYEITYDSKGLWGSQAYPVQTGNIQTMALIANILNGSHYTTYSDEDYDTPSLSDYLSLENDNMACFYWVVNYCAAYYYQKSFVFSEYIDWCITAYEIVEEYFQTHSRKLNPVFLAILKKKRKRWWK